MSAAPRVTSRRANGKHTQRASCGAGPTRAAPRADGSNSRLAHAGTRCASSKNTIEWNAGVIAGKGRGTMETRDTERPITLRLVCETTLTGSETIRTTRLSRVKPRRLRVNHRPNPLRRAAAESRSAAANRARFEFNWAIFSPADLLVDDRDGLPPARSRRERSAKEQPSAHRAEGEK